MLKLMVFQFLYIWLILFLCLHEDKADTSLHSMLYPFISIFCDFQGILENNLNKSVHKAALQTLKKS